MHERLCRTLGMGRESTLRLIPSLVTPTDDARLAMALQRLALARGLLRREDLPWDHLGDPVFVHDVCTGMLLPAPRVVRALSARWGGTPS